MIGSQHAAHNVLATGFELAVVAQKRWHAALSGKRANFKVRRFVRFGCRQGNMIRSLCFVS